MKNETAKKIREAMKGGEFSAATTPSAHMRHAASDLMSAALAPNDEDVTRCLLRVIARLVTYIEAE